MALANITLNSKALGGNVTTTVCFPEHRFEKWKPGEKYQVLWMLPGGGGDGSEWARYTCIENYAEKYKFFAVCPCTELSLTTDMYYGVSDNYYTFITQELPEMLSWMFPLSREPEDNFLIGFSMGGYGAFKWAMNFPGRFCKVGIFDGPMDIVATVTARHYHDGVLDPHFEFAFGTMENLKGSINDAMYIAEKNAAEGKFGAKLWVTSHIPAGGGEPDESAPKKLKELGYDVEWNSAPGDHSYLFCESRLPDFIKWAGFRGTPAKAK